MGNSQSDILQGEPYSDSDDSEADDDRVSPTPVDNQQADATTQDGQRIRSATESIRGMIDVDMEDTSASNQTTINQRQPVPSPTVSSSQGVQTISAVERVPVQFVWTHGGHEIFVVYSGDNWSQKHRMHKSFHDFSLILEVPPDTYYYKFIVDNQWRCAPDQEHVRDIHGAYSNVTVVQPQSVVSFIEENEGLGPKKRGRHGSIDLLTDKDYSQQLPEPESYISEPPLAPPQLGHILLNHPPTRDNHPLVLNKPPHVSLNHLYVADKREQEVVTFGITQRFRKKYFTTVYYKPITVNETLLYDGGDVVMGESTLFGDSDAASGGLSSSVISDYVQHNPYAEVV